MTTHARRSLATLTLIATLHAVLGVLAPATASAQVSSHPDAKAPLPENPYMSFREPWRWDLRAQLFLKPGYVLADDPNTPGRGYNERIYTMLWQPRQIELVYPVVREGGFYWSPNTTVDASIRLDDVELHALNNRPGRLGLNAPDAPVVVPNLTIEQKFAPGTYAEYSSWRSGDILGEYRQLHLIHTSHIVCADTVFNDDLARQLPWPQQWTPEAAAYLTPVVESVGAPVNDDAQETIETLLKYWIGEDASPSDASQLDVVKYLTGKVIEHFTIRGQATEYARGSTNRGGTSSSPSRVDRPSFVVSGNTWGGFIARPADVIAKAPQGSRNDLATLLTSVLRSAGIPARTVICINKLEEDPLLNTVSLVEFAMHDPERDLTFWVPIDVNRVRLTGGRSSQFRRKWLYFGSHDELSHMIPIAYFFHPPASYRAFDLPMLYGIRSTSDSPRDLPGYMIQSLLIEPIVTPIRGGEARPNTEQTAP